MFCLADYPKSAKYWLWLVLLVTLSATVSCGHSRLPWDRKPVDDLGEEDQVPTKTLTPPDSQPPPSVKGISSSSLQNLDAIQTALNVKPWLENGGNCSKSKIAIIDNGYMGLESSIGRRLPQVQVEESPGNPQMETAHGTKLAEIIWSLCTGAVSYSAESAKLGPEIKLYNGNGLTNFTSAVNQIQSGSFDFVVYSQVWEYGGNFDGKGFINALVNEVALETDTIWLNSAGNYGQSSWEGPLTFANQAFPNQASSESPASALLPLQKNRVKMIVESEATPIKITASWNDFTDDKSYRTTQDLDMRLLDYYGTVVAESKLIQDGVERTTTPGYSIHAREQLNTVLGAGIYEIELTSTNPAQFSRKSKVRISADGVGVRVEGIRPTSSVMIPADNPNVFAIGASDFLGSSFAISSNRLLGSVNKPEFMLPSKAAFLTEDKEKLEFVGTSSATAIAAATLMLHSSKCGAWTKNSLMEISVSLRKQAKDLSLPKDPSECLKP
jgi:hypothetical protein